MDDVNPATNAARQESLTIAWWNTSLAPSGVSRASDESRLEAASVLAYLFIASNADFIALGEMSIDDFKFLQNLEEFRELEFLSGIEKAGKSNFDICYIFRPTRLKVVETENITSTKGNQTLKIAQKVSIVCTSSGTFFTLLASHWPSRLWCEKNNAERHLLGIRLRDEVDGLLRHSDIPPHIILLGDYNDEPFDESMSSHLMATRDIELVRKREHLLYNPYWTKLGHSSTDPRTANSSAGSYYYKGGKITKWHTFDQIIYSHAFITESTWRLSKTNSHIAEVPGLQALIKNAKSKFDHLPVFGIIEKVA